MLAWCTIKFQKRAELIYGNPCSTSTSLLLLLLRWQDARRITVVGAIVKKSKEVCLCSQNKGLNPWVVISKVKRRDNDESDRLTVTRANDRKLLAASQSPTGVLNVARGLSAWRSGANQSVHGGTLRENVSVGACRKGHSKNMACILTCSPRRGGVLVSFQEFTGDNRKYWINPKNLNNSTGWMEF